MARDGSDNNSKGNGAIMDFEAMLLTATDELSDRPDGNKMDIKKLTKLLGLNLGIAAADIITISSGLIGSSILGTASGITIIILSVAGVIYGNYEILKPEKLKPKKPTPTPEYYIDALNKHREIKRFEKEIDLAIDQITRLQKKNKNIQDILPHAFDYSDITCIKFNSAIAEVKNEFCRNIQNILNKLKTFDEKDFIIEEHEKEAASQQIKKDKSEVYNEYVTSIDTAIENNEQILLNLEKLLLGISDLNCSDSGQRDQMTEMIDDLIKQLREHYKK